MTAPMIAPSRLKSKPAFFSAASPAAGLRKRWPKDRTPERMREPRALMLDEKSLTKKVKKIEKEMQDAAKNLEFEKAAVLRDQLKELKALLFGVEERE